MYLKEGRSLGSLKHLPLKDAFERYHQIIEALYIDTVDALVGF